MWPAVAEANDDGGERPGGGVFGHITLRATVSQLRSDSSERQFGRVRGPSASSAGSEARSAAVLVFVLIWA